jgi:hypothetical protein
LLTKAALMEAAVCNATNKNGKNCTRASKVAGYCTQHAKIHVVRQLPQNVPIQVQANLDQRIGRIRIGQQNRAKPYPKYDGFEEIAAWSRGKQPWKQLSPFFLGPVKFINAEGGLEEAQIFENFWQSFKVWENVEKVNKKEWLWPAEQHVTGELPNEMWYNWHQTLLHHNQPVRRPNGRVVPLYAWWFNQETQEYEKLDTIAARRKIYIPYLKQLYRAHPTYNLLLQKLRQGINLMLIEPDGPLVDAYPNGREISLELLEELIGKMNYGAEGYPGRYAPYGHTFVLATCLLEDA